MRLARELAERIVALRHDTLPPAALYGSRIAVLDTLGVTLAGSREEAPQIVEEVLGLQESQGPCLIFGTRRRASALDAALVNGTAAHVLDYDNTAANLGGHISAIMVPALIAAGEAIDASGQDLLVAHTAGFETGRVGLAVNPYHSEHGWPPTSTIGVFAVTAACARLLGLTVEQTETALALSTSLAAGTKANFGTMTKSLHAGQCARGGLMAALLAQKGFTANPDAFEHKQGFFKVFNGANNFDASRVLSEWCEPYDIVDPGASYKLYPCCYSTHAAVQAALSLAHEHGPFDARKIARVESFTHAARLMHTDRARPESALEAKFSVQYCVARALLDGKVSLEHFEGRAYADARVRDLLERVHAIPYTGALTDPNDPFDCEVRVMTTDGVTFATKVARPHGRTADDPIPFEQLQEKFEHCAELVLSAESAAAASRLIARLETVASIRSLTGLLEPVRQVKVSSLAHA